MHIWGPDTSGHVGTCRALRLCGMMVKPWSMRLHSCRQMCTSLVAKSRKLAPWSSRELSFTSLLSSVQLGQKATPTLKSLSGMKIKEINGCGGGGGVGGGGGAPVPRPPFRVAFSGEGGGAPPFWTPARPFHPPPPFLGRLTSILRVLFVFLDSSENQF